MYVRFFFFLVFMLSIGGCRSSSESPVSSPESPATSSESPVTSPELPVTSSELPATYFKGALIPLYSYPTEPAWKALIEANTTLDSIAIINPQNGPGITCNPDYQQGIMKLKNSSIKVIGYVYTKYGARSIEVVKADITHYKECYPNLDGIFLDETNSSSASAFYYSALYNYIKENNTSQKVVLNPGRYPDEEIVKASDIAIVYENSGESYDEITPPSYVENYLPEKFAILGYGVPQVSVTAQKLESLKSFRIGYVYLTDDNSEDDNPWDTLSFYYVSLIKMLSSKSL